MSTDMSSAETTVFTNGIKIVGNYGVVGDVHVGIKSDSSEFHESHDSLFKWVTDEFLKRKVTHVIFLGDLFHNRNEINVKSLSLGQRLVKELSKFFFVILIAGNHDLYYKNTLDISSLNIFEGFDNLKVISEPTEIEVNGEPVLLVPWIIDIDKTVKALKAHGQKYKWIFGHFEFKGGQLTQAHRNISHGYLLDDITQFLQSDGKIISGHFHLKRWMGKKVLYAGSALQLTWADADEEKSIYVIDPKNELEQINNEVTSKFIKINLSEVTAKKYPIRGNYIKLFVDRPASELLIKKAVEVINTRYPKSLAVVDLTIGNAVVDGESLEKIKDPILLMKEYLESLDLNKTEFDKQRLKDMVDEIYRDALTR